MWGLLLAALMCWPLVFMASHPRNGLPSSDGLSPPHVGHDMWTERHKLKFASSARVQQLLQMSRNLRKGRTICTRRRALMQSWLQAWAACTVRVRSLTVLQDLVQSRCSLLLLQQAFVEWMHVQKEAENTSLLASIQASSADYAALQAQLVRLLISML